jgi:hypothetical protein
MAMILGDCKLCDQHKELANESHIIPKFIFKEIMGDDRKIYPIKINGSLTNKQIIMPKKGLPTPYDKHLLCLDCESVFNKLETYSKEAIYGNAVMHVENPKVQGYVDQNGNPFSIIEKMDYTKYKLFLLSILWRAHISSRDMYKAVNLGPHADIIKKMIRNNDAGSCEDYPIIQTSYLLNKGYSKDYVGQFFKSRDKKTGLTLYHIIITGIRYMFFINSNTHTLPEYITKNTIKEDGSFHLIHLNRINQDKFLEHLGIAM